MPVDDFGHFGGWQRNKGIHMDGPCRRRLGPLAAAPYRVAERVPGEVAVPSAAQAMPRSKMLRKSGSSHVQV